jgi:hypothetical protein
MQQLGEGRVRPELKVLVREATQALARLDADRLEELARSCEALNLELQQNATTAKLTHRTALAVEAAGALREMAVLGRVLDATRANGRVMRTLLELRAGRREYGPFVETTQPTLESGHGND